MIFFINVGISFGRGVVKRNKIGRFFIPGVCLRSSHFFVLVFRL
jgi:hypothetical protein